MTYTCFEIEQDGGVAHLKLNRPEMHNAMVAEFWTELPDAVRALDDGGETRALVISSTGKHFCSGIDLGLLASLPHHADAEEGRMRAHLMQTVRALQGTFSALDQARFPIVVAINGACIGGGIDFSSACDIRLCTSDAFFCIQEINVGLVADVGTFPRLVHQIPQGLLRELAYTGRRWSAEEARAAGFVNQVFETREAAVVAALDMARTIASKSPLAQWGTKEMLNHSRDHGIEETLKHISVWQSGMLSVTDIKASAASLASGEAADLDDLLPVAKDAIG